MSAKNPRTPPGPLSSTSDDVRTLASDQVLFRIHTVDGRHPVPWNGLREFGPLPQSRWEPQPAPQRQHAGNGVAYTATDPTTAFAEVFQNRRRIRVTSDKALSAWSPTRPLRLLDLTGTWPIRNGASSSLHAAPKSTTRNWAHQIHVQLAAPLDLDGLYVPLTMTLAPMVVLFHNARSAFPAAPVFSQLLNQRDARILAAKAAHALNWPLL